jgi:hypothetical protein
VLSSLFHSVCYKELCIQTRFSKVYSERSFYMGSLIIAFHAPGRKPVSVASINDSSLLKAAALIAIEQAEQRATDVSPEDPILGALQRVEVARLRASLSVLIPGLMAIPLLSRSGAIQ